MSKLLKPSSAFLVLAFVFGSIFLALTPPFQVPDESFHFLRAYQISRGELGEKDPSGQRGVWIPASAHEFLSAFDHVPMNRKAKVSAEETLRFRHFPLDPKNERFIPYATALPHPPLPYLPQALAMALGRGLELSPFHLLYLARIFNLLAWMALVFAAIRLSPIYPWLLALLALTPMSLHQAASLSPDAVTNGVAFFFFASLLRVVLSQTNPPPRILPAAISSLALTLSKLAYAAQAWMFFLIPRKTLGSRKRFWWIVPALVLANLVLAFAILKLGETSAQPTSPSRTALILADPLGFIRLLANTFAFYGASYLEQFLGRLGHLDTPLPFHLLIYQAALLLLFACLERAPGPGLSPGQKLFVLALLAAEVLALWTGLYLTWMETGVGVIRGGQGRYLIPLGPFFFLLFYRPAQEGAAGIPRRIQILAVYSVMMILSVSLYFLWRRFYVAG